MKPTPVTVSVNQEKYIPFGKLLIEGAQDHLGPDHLKRVLRDFPSRRMVTEKAGDPNSTGCSDQDGFVLYPGEIEQFALTMKSVYGTQGGRGLMVRIGRSTFHQIIKYYGKASNLLIREFLILPIPNRLPIGLERLAGVFKQYFQQLVEVQEQDSSWLWCVEYPLHTHDLQTAQDPDCYLMVGILQEYMTWASGGRFYRVAEQQCFFSGSRTCIFRIDKKALD